MRRRRDGHVAFQHAAHHALRIQRAGDRCDGHRVIQATGFHQFDVDQIRCAAFQNADRVGRSKDTFIGQNRRVDALGDIAHALQIARFDGLLHELCVKIRIFQH